MTDFQPMIERVSREIATALRRELIAAVSGESSSVTQPKPKKPRKPKTAAQMRCRYRGNKKRCAKRSKGPKYRYLCEEHLE